MAWVELPEKRSRRGRVYQDDADPLKGAWSGTLAALHYETVLDSGLFDAEVDAAPVRVDNPVFDGWRVMANGWHYALGKDLENHGDQDGWVGFGGRQGAHWFKFRLTRVGYLHWPTRAWDDIGGVPTYDRTNLAQQTHALVIGPNDDVIPVQSVATWSGIWVTPGGGDLSVRWAVNGDRLKEEVIVNQAGREWIAGNRPPATPLNETWFGFVFALDWLDVPRVYRAGVLQDVDGDWADDGEQVELKDGLDQLLAFLPLGDVRVPLEDADDIQPVRKRFWSEGGNHYLLVGVRCDVLNGMAAGDLVFDPTVNEQVGASADDAHEHGDATFDAADEQLKIYSHTDSGSGNYRCAGCRFQTVAVPNGATIDSAYLSLYSNDTYDDLNVDVFANDVDDAVDFSTDADVINRTRTSASVSWVSLNVTQPQYEQSPTIATVIKEIVDRGGWATGQDMVILVIGKTDAVYTYRCEAWDDAGNANNPKLDITYTAAAVGQPMMLRATTVPGLRQWQPRIGP